MIKRWMHDDVLSRVQDLRPVAEEVGLSMAALAVAWVLQNDNVATAIIGASRPEQVHDNAAAAGVRLTGRRAQPDRRDPRPGDRAGPGQDLGQFAEDPRGLTIQSLSRMGEVARRQSVSSAARC